MPNKAIPFRSRKKGVENWVKEEQNKKIKNAKKIAGAVLVEKIEEIDSCLGYLIKDNIRLTAQEHSYLNRAEKAARELRNRL